MMETSYIIRLNIKHYHELLKLNGVSGEQRPTVVKLLAEALAKLPLAVAEEAGVTTKPTALARPSLQLLPLLSRV